MKNPTIFRFARLILLALTVFPVYWQTLSPLSRSSVISKCATTTLPALGTSHGRNAVPVKHPLQDSQKTGFYGDITLDPDAGVELVKDLVQKFYPGIYTHFVSTQNGMAGLEAATSIRNFLPGELPTISADQVSTDNYLDVLKTVAGQIARLTLLWVQASPSVSFLDGSKRGYSVLDLSSPDYCAYAQQCAIDGWNNTDWGTIWDQCNAQPGYTHQVHNHDTISRVFEISVYFDGSYWFFPSAWNTRDALPLILLHTRMERIRSS